MAIAASAGGIAAVSVVLGGLPADFPAPVIVVEHIHEGHRSLLAPVLGRTTILPVTEAVQDEELVAGTVYVAPPGRHTTVRNGCVLLDDSPAVSWVRPSATRLFESIAAEYRRAALAVVLSGTGSDGAAGALLVLGAGGTVIAQDPEHAEFAGMPAAAVAAGAQAMPLEDISGALVAHVRGTVPA